MTKREAHILDHFYFDYEQIKPPPKPFRQEDFDEYFVKKYSRETFFDYLNDNLYGSNPIKCIGEFITAIRITSNNVHKESILSRCLKEELIFANEVLKALTRK